MFHSRGKMPGVKLPGRGSHCITVEWWYNYPAPGNFVKRNLENLS